MDDILTDYIAEHPELSDSTVDALENFFHYYMDKVGLEGAWAENDARLVTDVDRLYASLDAIRTLTDVITTTRVKETEAGPEEESWLNKGESEQIKKLLFKYVDTIFGGDIQHLHTQHGN